MRYIYILFILFFIGCSNGKLDYESSDLRYEEAMKLFSQEKYLKAKEQFKYMIFNNPGSKNALDSQFYLAECFYLLEEYDQASKEYEKYISMSQDSDLVKKSKFLAAKCYYELSLSYYKDQTDTKYAISKIQNFIEQYSDNKQNIILHNKEIDLLENSNDMIDELRLRLAKKDLESGKLYIRLRKYNAALTYFNSILLEYYDTEYNDDAIYSSVLTYLKMKDLKSANKFLLSNKDNFYNQSNYDKVQKIIDNYSLDKKSYEYIPGILGGVYLLQLGLE